MFHWLILPILLWSYVWIIFLPSIDKIDQKNIPKLNSWRQLWQKKYPFLWLRDEAVSKANQKEVFDCILFQVGLIHSMYLIFTVQVLYFTTASVLFSITPLIFCHKGQYFPYWKSHSTSVIVLAVRRVQC